MAITGNAVPEAETPLLDDVVSGAVDFHSRPSVRSKSGSWKSGRFILGVEAAERFAYCGISSNLINYFTGPLGQSVATAAANVNAWVGAASMLPLIGAFVADSFLGQFRTIIIASVLYVVALGLLSISASIHTWNSSQCNETCSPPLFELVIFFFSLYLVAFAQGGHKPCVQAFGADQFDDEDESEHKAKSSFFNWWYFSMNGGILVGLVFLSYIQDNLSWELGFGIPCIAMCFALIIFSLGSTTYRFRASTDERNPFVRIGRVFLRATRNRKIESTTTTKFLDKAILTPDSSVDDGNIVYETDIDDAKSILRLLPIWSSCLGYAIVAAQVPTLFTKQGATMDRKITPSFEVPSASLQSLVSLSTLVFIPIYDRVLVPTARSLTGKPAGITMLQRIGTGVFLSFILMVLAALVEGRRREEEAAAPMSVWWLAPQYAVFGVANVFTMVGLQAFFYDQMPVEMKSIGLAMYLSIFGVGSFLSSFLISVVERATRGGDGDEGWLSNDLNRAHLDYFYWLLAGLTAATMVTYVYFAKTYVYKRKNCHLINDLEKLFVKNVEC